MSLLPSQPLPLNALRVFHAVVRGRSFRAASEALRVSPQAVSQQIRQLEETLGVALFTRQGRAVEPTEAAILLSHFIDAGFAEIEEGLRRVTRNAHRQRINVNASPYFAQHFLLDRFARFREILPDADLRLTTMVDMPDFAADDVDVTIQWGFGSFPPHEATLLVRDPKVLCCAPAVAERLQSPQDLVGVPLLHTAIPGTLWPDILRHLGVEGDSKRADMRLQDAATMRRATLAGLGVGLLSHRDATEDLASGALVAPFGAEALANLPPEQVPGFYLVVPRSHRRVRAIRSFCDWITREDWDR
ncbi:LysR substrate-binding domain-containing protein [Pararhodobacter sp. CCB-MM2]|uniref:LysR substrate-binding domain-containing protein n=1 Tax=Pararhodobacter sp. CCB-MM2 TaxID=1786003 RepID=UPI00082BAF65|nr:LysR substrate-binding domain-containing protein [Pararhodobacter sp. CCB-MM2]